jgi:hypothetical protein
MLILIQGIESDETKKGSHQILFYSTQESRLFYSIPSKNRLFRFLEGFQWFDTISNEWLLLAVLTLWKVAVFM